MLHANGIKKKVIDYFFTQNLAEIQNSFNINLAPLEYACRYGSLDCVKILINHENNLNISNYQIEKAFKRALIGGHLDIIQFLLKTKKSIKISFYSILAAISSNYLDVAKFLISSFPIKKKSSGNNNIIERLTKKIYPTDSLAVLKQYNGQEKEQTHITKNSDSSEYDEINENALSNSETRKTDYEESDNEFYEGDAYFKSSEYTDYESSEYESYEG